MNMIQFPSTSRPVPSVERLTPREREIVGLAHLTNEGIAEAIGCKPATVKAHWDHIRLKLGAENRTQAALLCVAPNPCGTGVEAQTAPVFFHRRAA